MTKIYKSIRYQVFLKTKQTEKCITSQATLYSRSYVNMAWLARTALLFSIILLWHLHRPLQAQTIHTIDGHGFFEMGTSPFVCSCCVKKHSDKDDKTQSPVVSARFEPFAKWHGLDHVSLMIEVNDNDVVEIRWQNFLFQRFGEPLDTIILLDDGTQGDDVAGDNIFTIDGISRRSVSYIFDNDPAPAFSYELPLTLVYSNGNEKEIVLRSSLFSLDPDVVPVPSVYRGELGEHIDHTEFVIGIFDSTTNRMEVAQQYYQVMDDDRDFLFIASRQEGTSNVAGYFTHVKSTVQGIGVSEVDFTASYGSTGRLMGVISLTPSAPFGLINHEILHQWSNFLDPSLDFGQIHWGMIEKPSTGFGASGHGVYTTFEPLTDNRYRAMLHNWNDPEAKKFNDLELYKMGLIDISEVESPIRTLVNPTTLHPLEFVHEDGNTYGIFEADGIREVAVEEITAIHGVRTPGPDEAQTSFAGGMVVVHHRPLTLAEFAYYDFMMREFEKDESEHFLHSVTFEQATNGLANITTRLFPPLTPNPVTLLTPEPNEQHEESSVSFSWQKLSGVDHYHIQVALDNSFNDMVVDNQLVAGNKKVVDDLSHNTTYYWRVRAENEAGTGDWSETWSFWTYPLSTAATYEGTLKVFPNPARNQVTVAYPGPEPITQIVVYDLLGQELVRKERVTSSVAQVDLGHLNAGMYLLHVLTADQQSVTKIQVAR